MTTTLPPDHVTDEARRILMEDERAYRDAMKHIARGIPEPERVANYLPARMVMALGRCEFVNGTGWRMQYSDRASLVGDECLRWGLVGAGGDRFLTVHGTHVLKALKREDA